MKIEEILEYIQKYTDEYETTNLTEIRALQIGYVDTVLLLDYITNLQSNWNSLRDYLIQLQKLKGINQQGFSWGVAQEILDKMNELEGKDKE